MRNKVMKITYMCVMKLILHYISEHLLRTYLKIFVGCKYWNLLINITVCFDLVVLAVVSRTVSHVLTCVVRVKIPAHITSPFCLQRGQSGFDLWGLKYLPTLQLLSTSKGDSQVLQVTLGLELASVWINFNCVILSEVTLCIGLEVKIQEVTRSAPAAPSVPVKGPGTCCCMLKNATVLSVSC